MYQKYAGFEKILMKFEKFFVMIAFVLIFITVVIQGVQRAFNLPIPDTSDLSIIAQSVFTFMCVGMLVNTQGHITIEVHKMIKNREFLYIVEMIKNVVTLIFAGLFIYLGYDLAAYAITGGTATMAMRIPLWIPYGAMLIGLIFMVLHTIGEMMRLQYCKKHDLPFAEEEDIESMR